MRQMYIAVEEVDRNSQSKNSKINAEQLRQVSTQCHLILVLIHTIMRVLNKRNLAIIGVRPCAAPKLMMFFPPTTTAMAAPGFEGNTSAANAVLVIRIDVKVNWKSPQPVYKSVIANALNRGTVGTYP